MRKLTFIVVLALVTVVFGIILAWPVRIVVNYESVESYDESENYYENVPFEYHTRWQIFTEDVSIPVDTGGGVIVYFGTQRWTNLTVWVYNDDSIGGTFKVQIPIYDSGLGWESHGMMAGENKYIVPDNYEIWEFINIENLTDEPHWGQKYELPEIIPPIKQIQQTRMVTKTRTIIENKIVEKRVVDLLLGR